MKTEKLTMARARVAAASVAVVSAALVAYALAQQMDWFPKGGRQLLVEVTGACADCDDLSELATMDRTREEWRAYFDERGALADLTEAQLATLVAYLELNLPREGVSREALTSGPYAEPVEGPTLTMEACSVCHSLSLTLLSDRSEEQWAQFVLSEQSSHSEHVTAFDFSEAQWRTFAAYLAHNMPMELEDIPEPYRETGGQEAG